MPAGVKAKIVDLLCSNRDQAYTPEEIAEQLGVERVAVVKAQLTRLVKEGRVEKLPDGRYKCK